MKIETTTYKELSEWFERWGLGCSNFIVLESEGGLGKTSIMFETLKGQKFHYFNTHVTPVAMYIQLVNRPELPIVFDDVDGLTDEPVKVALMKQLCETRVRKKVQWTSTTKLLEDYPQSFETSAPVLVLTNRMKNRDPAIGALLDRGDHLYFKPTPDEVLAYIKRILAKLEFHKPVTLKEKQMVFKYFDKQVRANKSIISVRTFMHCIEDYLYDKTKRRDRLGNAEIDVNPLGDVVSLLVGDPGRSDNINRARVADRVPYRRRGLGKTKRRGSGVADRKLVGRRRIGARPVCRRGVELRLDVRRKSGAAGVTRRRKRNGFWSTVVDVNFIICRVYCKVTVCFPNVMTVFVDYVGAGKARIE